jgi:hypothetical protein
MLIKIKVERIYNKIRKLIKILVKILIKIKVKRTYNKIMKLIKI